MKGKTAGKVTVNSIEATAAQLATLDTGKTDSVTMTASGNSTVTEAIALVEHTDALSKITIAGIQDGQNNVSGAGIANSATGLTTLKTLVGTSATSTAIDSLYGRVSGTVTINDGALTVDNAISIATFTVGSSNSSISYTISDSAGHSSGDGDDIGVATTKAAPNHLKLTLLSIKLLLLQLQEL